jgi:nucleoside-diphosphate-sugar epimerase
MGICPLAGYRSPRLAFVHVEDCVNAILAASVRGTRCEGRYPHDGAGRGVYFVADDEFLTISGFKDRVLKGLGRRFAVPVPLPIPILYAIAMLAERVSRWRGNVSTFNRDKIREAACSGWTCDTRSTREELDWGPARSLADHLDAFAVDYRERMAYHA